MSDMHSELFNLVILPTSGAESAAGQRFMLSATRVNRDLRLVSPEWSMAEVRSALADAGASNVQVEELLRGNRMAYGGKSTRYLYFTDEQLRTIGLVPVD